MKVAIIGAGVAGLACAHELERHGISPVIYERASYIGEHHPHVTAILGIIHRPIKDSVQYFKKELCLDIQPLNRCNKIVHYSPNKETVITGNLGYFFQRDKEPGNVKGQIYSTLKNTKVEFSTIGDYEPLAREYDYVLVADGTTGFTKELGCWKEWLNTYVKGALVYGDFDPNTLMVWINKDTCKNGYAYLTPFDNKRASLALVVTEADEREVDLYWEMFLNSENIKYTIGEEFKLNHKSGHVYPHKVGNIYFAGDSGGVIDPFLGFGQMNSLAMGVFCARAIAEGKDYEKLLKKMVTQNLRLHEFRKVFDLSNNTGYDILMSSLSIPGIKHLLYYTPLNVVRTGAFLMKMIPKKNK